MQMKGGVAGANIICFQNHQVAQIRMQLYFLRKSEEAICGNPSWVGFKCTHAVDKGQKKHIRVCKQLCKVWEMQGSAGEEGMWGEITPCRKRACCTSWRVQEGRVAEGCKRWVSALPAIFGFAPVFSGLEGARVTVA